MQVDFTTNFKTDFQTSILADYWLLFNRPEFEIFETLIFSPDVLIANIPTFTSALVEFPGVSPSSDVIRPRDAESRIYGDDGTMYLKSSRVS